RRRSRAGVAPGGVESARGAGEVRRDRGTAACAASETEGRKEARDPLTIRAGAKRIEAKGER
ncbi:MAG TPA: hypothetical protein VK392_02515, partial [Thermoanaerobaculia bacterium]|nr:hypothetical protein [Thermoanaerobaculia bacterium]